MLVLSVIGAGDLLGKKALRVTIEYNIPVKTFISLLKEDTSLGVILEKWFLVIILLYTYLTKPRFDGIRFGDIKVWIVMFSRGKVLGVRNV